MRACIVVLATTAFLLLSPLQPLWAISESSNQLKTSNDLDLPSALSEDDSFNELPFEQLRQALREEVERDPHRNPKSHVSTRYNLLIR